MSGDVTVSSADELAEALILADPEEPFDSGLAFGERFAQGERWVTGRGPGDPSGRQSVGRS